MPRTEAIEEHYADPTLNLALDTLAKKKQALIFCNTKRGAESQAEKIAEKVKTPPSPQLTALAEQILSVVSSPTRQCKRLALCVRAGIAFHHAGLHAKQRELVETAFRESTLSIITATPTLAMGMDLPAYRSIIRDLKRYSQGTSWGMADIPVLEYEQMAGRAGRPGKEDKGEALCIATSDSEQERITQKYLLGAPEDIYSKLAVEPVLRTYVLSLIASGYVHDTDSLYGFFDQTFYAWQYGDKDLLHRTLDKMVHLLQGWHFIEGYAGSQDEFVSAQDLVTKALRATPLGARVAQLYLDPYTAYHLLTAIEQAIEKKLPPKELPLLQLLASTLEIRPLFSVRQAEIGMLDELLLQHEDSLFVPAPSAYAHEYDEFLQSMKTALVLQAWISETGEDVIHEEHNVTPGELQAKLSIADWLLYALVELGKLKKWHALISEFEKMRVRLEQGAKEELLALLRLKGIGRVRARKLYHNGVRSLDDVRKAELSSLRALIGERIAESIKEQLGEKLPQQESVAPNKRKGQINLGDFSSN